jgi:hypothetical protein
MTTRCKFARLVDRALDREDPRYHIVKMITLPLEGEEAIDLVAMLSEMLIHFPKKTEDWAFELPEKVHDALSEQMKRYYGMIPDTKLTKFRGVPIEVV